MPLAGMTAVGVWPALVSLPRVNKSPSLAAAGMAPSTIEPAAPAAAAPASFRRLRRLCGRLSWPLPFPFASPGASSFSSRALRAST